MILYGTFSDNYGHHVVKFSDRRAVIVAHTRADLNLADRIAWFLENEYRIGELWDRHGAIDVPLTSVPLGA